ncbi:MAG: hypothetical protein M3P96_04925 [Actinomycetota bacterium]|nr:hypothetical protein [Actinomycetota bacterium]
MQLRALMFEGMGTPVGGPDAAWCAAADAWFRDRLERTATFAAFVVEEPGLGVVSAAAGICDAEHQGRAGSAECADTSSASPLIHGAVAVGTPGPA